MAAVVPGAGLAIGVGGSTAAAALEGRLLQVEQLLQQQLQQERRERQALEERVRRLELVGAASGASAATPLCEKPASSTKLVDLESESSDDGDAHFCGLLSRNAAKSYGIVTADDLAESYALEESMWDASIFVFMECLELVPSITVIGLLVLNILIQTFFVFVVYMFMCEDSMSSELLVSLLKFRAGVAHSIKYADIMQGMSLATQVCDNDQKIPWAGSQMGLIGDIESAREGGIYLCTLAVLCWLLTLISELDSSVRFGTAMLSLVKGGQRTLLMDGDGAGGEDGTRLECISARRFAFVLVLVVLPRLVVGTVLALVGIKFLVVTTSMGDLLLNALALSFIMDVDNMLYAAFAPQRLKAIVRSVAPVTLPPKKKGARGFHGFNTGAKVLLVFSVLLAVFCCYIRPFYGRMNQAYDVICSGHRNFVYATNAASGFVEASTSYTKPVVDWTSQELSVLQLAKPKLQAGPDFPLPQKVTDAIASESRTALLHVSWRDSTEMLRNITHFLENLSISELDPSIGGMLDLRRTMGGTIMEGTRSMVCADMGFSTNEDLMMSHLQQISRGLGGGHPRLSSCQEAKHLCGLRNMTFLRALCPETCGCRRYLAPPASFFAAPGFGCPKRCSAELQAEMRAEMESGQVFSCIDSPPSRFVDDPALRKYFHTFMQFMVGDEDSIMSARSAVRRNTHTLGMTANQSERAFLALVDGTFLQTVLNGRWELLPGHPHPRGLQGCDFWTSWEINFMLGIDFCSISDFRSLRPYCPVSCGCHQGSLLCPPSCTKRMT